MKVIKYICMLLILLVVGIGGYRFIEDFSWLDSFFMTIITLSTVGYGEVAPLSYHGKIFTIFLILIGISYFGYIASNLIGFIVSGELNFFLRERKMNTKISKLKDHIIVCGFGDVGKKAAQDIMSSMERELVIIEKDSDICLEAEKQGFYVVCGDSTSDEVLKLAGIERAKGIITAFNNEAESVYTILTVKEINKSVYIVARGKDKKNERIIYRAGADRVVSPPRIGGSKMAEIVCQSETLDKISRIIRDRNIDIRFAEANISDDAPIVGKTLAESRIKESTGGILVIGIKPVNSSIILNPPSDLKFAAEDKVILLGNKTQLQKFRDLIQAARTEVQYIES